MEKSKMIEILGRKLAYYARIDARLEGRIGRMYELNNPAEMDKAREDREILGHKISGYCAACDDLLGLEKGIASRRYYDAYHSKSYEVGADMKPWEADESFTKAMFDGIEAFRMRGRDDIKE